MGFLISINGADFQPYDMPTPRTENIPSAPSAVRVPAISPDTPDSFREALEHAAVGLYQQQAQVGERISKRAVRAKDIMTQPVITLNQSSKLDRARQLIANHDFHHLPIVDDNGALSGMLSDRDLLKISLSKASPLIENIMSKDVIAATPETLLREVALVLRHHRIHCLPIIDEINEPIGIITTTDILNALLKRVDLSLWA